MRWLRRLLGSDDERAARAVRQEGYPTALDRARDPRAGTQSEAYRRADPREIVLEGGTAMSGPGGAPQDGLSVEERRARDRRD